MITAQLLGGTSKESVSLSRTPVVRWRSSRKIVQCRLQNVSKTAAELWGLARSFAELVLVLTSRRSSESTNWRASSPC
jgi:hypothetical protein